MKKNRLYAAIIVLVGLVAFLHIGCKREGITSVTTKETGKIYFPGADSTYKGAINNTSNFVNDTTNKVVVLPVPLYRGGFTDLDSFQVSVGVDNSNIAGLISSGILPSKTVVLANTDYTLDSVATMAYTNGLMQCNLLPKVKAASIGNYGGKYVALGLVIKSSTKFDINPTMNKVVVYFNADSVLEAITPRTNLISDITKWVSLNISNSNDVTETVNTGAGSILFKGGNGGYNQAAVYQGVKLFGKLQYNVNMMVQGSGATNVWFEVWITQKKPQDGQDIGTGFDPTAVKIMGLNTWDGCGGSPFNGWLATVGCGGKGNYTPPTTGTYYITIKAGGNDLGTTGITASQFTFF